MVQYLENGTDEVAVFDNTAVKSTFNSGTWSRETADILKQQSYLHNRQNHKSKANHTGSISISKNCRKF